MLEGVNNMQDLAVFVLIGLLLALLVLICLKIAGELRFSIMWPIMGITGLIVMYNMGMIPTGSL